MKSKEEENVQRLRDYLRKGRNCIHQSVGWGEEEKENNYQGVFIHESTKQAMKVLAVTESLL